MLEVQRRVQGRVPLPQLEITSESMQRHQASATPILRFEDIPLDLSDLRLMVRQTADVLRRYGALEESDYRKIQSLGRDMQLIEVTGQWFRNGFAQQVAAVGMPAANSFAELDGAEVIDQVLTRLDETVPLAMRRGPAAAPGAVALDARALRALRRPARLLGDHAVCRASLDLRTLRAALEVGIAHVSVLPQQRAHEDHVVCDTRRTVSGLCV